MTLTELGFGPFSARLPDGAWPARIISEHRGALEAHDGAFLRSLPPHPQAAVGDWVHLRDGPDGLRIVHLVERINAVQRKAVGAFTGRQTVAANLNRVFIVTSMNNDLKLSLIERFLVATRGIPTTVVLNKADLGMSGSALREIKALGCDAVATSALSGVGLEQHITALATAPAGRLPFGFPLALLERRDAGAPSAAAYLDLDGIDEGRHER